MEKLLTSKEFALAIGASESSLRRWTNSGVIKTSRTVGGHRRIALSEAIRFIRETRTVVVRPQLLGLPVGSRTSTDSDTRGAEEEAIYAALLNGDAELARGRILGLYLAGATLASLFDGPIGHAMHRVGELWKHDRTGILIEHRATDICLQALGQLRQMLSPATADAPVALGGAPGDDPYLLPSLMAATLLAEAGYRETNFGPNTPLDLLANAAEEQKASLVWLAFSVADAKGHLQRSVLELSIRLRALDAQLIVGGRHAASLVSPHMPNVHVLQSMTELAAFVRGAKPALATSTS